jgi:hypothetical protein
MVDFSSFNYPSQWGEASDFWSKMLETGMPTDIEPWWKSQQQAAGVQIERAGKEAAEQFGLGGMRYSTPLGQQLGRIGAETTAGIMPQYWGMGMQAQEAAKGRQMGAAQNLFGAGGEMARFPMEVGERMLGMGGEYQRQQMQSMYPMMQEWQRMTPEQSPWLQYGMGFPYGQFGQMPQMYQQSPFGQALGVGAEVAPWLLGGGG